VHLHEANHVGADALIAHQLPDDEILIAVLAGEREDPAFEILEGRDREILAHDDGRPVAWPRYAIFTFTPCSRSFIRQRRDHERRIEPAALERLDHRGKVREALGFEARRAARFRRVVGDGTCQVAGHRQNPTASVARGIPSPPACPVAVPTEM